MGQHHTIIYNLQLFINNYGSEDNLMTNYKVFSKIIIEDYFKIFKPIAELDNITIILKLYDV